MLLQTQRARQTRQTRQTRRSKSHTIRPSYIPGICSVWGGEGGIFIAGRSSIEPRYRTQDSQLKLHCPLSVISLNGRREMSSLSVMQGLQSAAPKRKPIKRSHGVLHHPRIITESGRRDTHIPTGRGDVSFVFPFWWLGVPLLPVRPVRGCGKRYIDKTHHRCHGPPGRMQRDDEYRITHTPPHPHGPAAARPANPTLAATCAQNLRVEHFLNKNSPHKNMDWL